jgi:putative transposase
MKSVRIVQLKHLPGSMRAQIYDGHIQAGLVWNQCSRSHSDARKNKTPWPNKASLQKETKGKFALHSQSIQMVCHGFLANVDTAKKLRKENSKIRYPYKEKRFYPLMWPSQAISHEKGRLVLPMGRGRQSLVLKVDVAEKIGSCKIVYKDGLELHIVTEKDEVKNKPDEGVHATVDLGEIHQAAVTTNTGKAVVISGRGIRTLKRQRAKLFGQIAQKRSRCKKGSKRHKKLMAARRKVSQRSKNRIRDLRHKGTRKVIDFCKNNGVQKLFVGHPKGISQKNSGRKHNQRMSNWEFFKDIQYLEEKAEHSHIECFTGSERGTSSQCPRCEHKKKARGRWWKCPKCLFSGHRDLVGSVNMHPIGFNEKVIFPFEITYLLPGQTRRSSSLGTGQSCLRESISYNHQPSWAA